MRTTILALGLCLFAGSTSALAEGAARPALLVLDLEAKGASALEAAAATQHVVRGLRELDVFSVLSAEDVRQLLALERSRQLVGAGSGNELSEMSKALGAKHAVVGSLTRVGATYSLELRLMDAVQSTVVSQKAVPEAASFQALAPQVSPLAQVLMGPLLADQQGTLLVHGRDEGAEVYLDGTLVASLPMKEALKLPRGSHRLQVKKEAFIAMTRSVRIDQEQLTVEEVTLVPSPAFARTFKEDNAKKRLIAYAAAGGGAALLLGALAMDRLVVDPGYRTQFLPRQLALQGRPLTSDLASVQALQDLWSACDADLLVCTTEAKNINGALTAQQVVTGSLVVLGLGGLGAAGYFYFTGQDPNRYSGLVASVAPSADGASLVLGGKF